MKESLGEAADGDDRTPRERKPRGRRRAGPPHVPPRRRRRQRTAVGWCPPGGSRCILGGAENERNATFTSFTIIIC
jgi:hypothetical protein